jgi:hypothetical protein
MRTFHRLGLLLRSAETLAPPVDEDPKADVHRAVVVFAHAALEDTLRSVGAAYLPYASEDALNKIGLAPAPGEAGALRPEKFFLGRLATHRGRTVDEVIRESVRAHLSTKSFSSIEDIDHFIAACGLDANVYRESYPRLAPFITRRHQIVHRADVPEGADEPEPITRAEVEEWLGAVVSFTSTLLGAHDPLGGEAP